MHLDLIDVKQIGSFMSKAKKTYYDQTSADKNIAGIDYQFYFFLWKILELKPGHVIGWEVKDDIHLSIGDKLYLYQLKHTTQKRADNKPINFTTYENDLWKTIGNWYKVIIDSNDGRIKKDDQLKFLNKTTFILATNKSSSSDNIFLSMILEYQEKLDEKIINDKLKQLKENTDNEVIIEIISKLQNLDPQILKEFICRIKFETDENEIISKCKLALKADKIPEHRIDDVFKKIAATLHEDKFITVSSGEKVVITFDDFYIKYRKYYDNARNQTLQIQPYTGSLPTALTDQIFIKQLIEIGDLEELNTTDIIEFTRFKLLTRTNISKWHQDGEITVEEKEILKNDAINKWKNVFRGSHIKDTNEETINNSARKILKEIRSLELRFDEQTFNSMFSNGYYYDLSDEPIIGWRSDWTKYKK